MSEGQLVVGVDVGGTFTDVFVLDEASGELRVAKVPSTTSEASWALAIDDNLVMLATAKVGLAGVSR